MKKLLALLLAIVLLVVPLGFAPKETKAGTYCQHIYIEVGEKISLYVGSAPQDMRFIFSELDDSNIPKDGDEPVDREVDVRMICGFDTANMCTVTGLREGICAFGLYTKKQIQKDDDGTILNKDNYIVHVIKKNDYIETDMVNSLSHDSKAVSEEDDDVDDDSSADEKSKWDIAYTNKDVYAFSGDRFSVTVKSDFIPYDFASGATTERYQPKAPTINYIKECDASGNDVSAANSKLTASSPYGNAVSFTAKQVTSPTTVYLKGQFKYATSITIGHYDAKLKKPVYEPKWKYSKQKIIKVFIYPRPVMKLYSGKEEITKLDLQTGVATPLYCTLTNLCPSDIIIASDVVSQDSGLLTVNKDDDASEITVTSKRPTTEDTWVTITLKLSCEVTKHNGLQNGGIFSKSYRVTSIGEAPAVTDDDEEDMEEESEIEDDFDEYEDEDSNNNTKVKKTSIKSAKLLNKKKIKVKIKKVSGAKGYQVRVIGKIKGKTQNITTKNIKNKTTATISSSKIKKYAKKGTIYIKARAYKYINNKKTYSSWSKKKKIK